MKFSTRTFGLFPRLHVSKEVTDSEDRIVTHLIHRGPSFVEDLCKAGANLRPFDGEKRIRETEVEELVIRPMVHSGLLVWVMHEMGLKVLAKGARVVPSDMDPCEHTILPHSLDTHRANEKVRVAAPKHLHY